MTKTDVYQIVTDRVLEALERGVAPWRKPWTVDGIGPSSLATGKPYQGVNVFLLGMQPFGSPWWTTFKGARTKGGAVRKGEKGSPIVFWSFVERKDRETGEKERVPLLRYYSVFNAEQCEGLELPEAKADARTEFERIEECERIAEGYANGPAIRYGGARAFYCPSDDIIAMPERETFTTAAGFYAVLFHEMAHSTGHEKRLNRSIRNGFGSADYGREELCAEMAAAFLSSECGILSDDLFENTAAYIDSWKKAVREDVRAVVVAAGAAQKAADWIRGRNQPETDEEHHAKE